MCNDPTPMSKRKAITIKILGPDGKWKTLKTDSVTEGIKKLKKTVRQNSKDSSQYLPPYPGYPVTRVLRNHGLRRQQQKSFRWFGGWERSNLTRFCLAGFYFIDMGMPPLLLPSGRSHTRFRHHLLNSGKCTLRGILL